MYEERKIIPNKGNYFSSNERINPIEADWLTVYSPYNAHSLFTKKLQMHYRRASSVSVAAGLPYISEYRPRIYGTLLKANVRGRGEAGNRYPDNEDFLKTNL
ncbi:UNVERIFIED_CONTAM: hypothetical protein NCL1_45810 [Trichonephila clavipes]